MEQRWTAASSGEGGAGGGDEDKGGAVEAFDYPACPGAPPLPGWDGWTEAGESSAPNVAHDHAHGHAKSGSAGATALNFEQRLAEETRKSFAAGRERGRQEVAATEREAQAAEVQRHKNQLVELVEKFAGERDRFLEAVEQEVVRLALAVAARILRREAQMVPLLLTGAVRVALGQLARSSEVRLKVPAVEVDLWTETIALLPNRTPKPVVISDEELRLGDCVVESNVGTVDLGIRSQLAEIERGFFDRAAAGSSKANAESSKTNAGSSKISADGQQLGAAQNTAPDKVMA